MATPSEIAANFSRTVEMQRQDTERQRIHLLRLELEAKLSEFNSAREAKGMGPVTLRIPEETS
jgi:hypothetical protein